MIDLKARLSLYRCSVKGNYKSVLMNKNYMKGKLV